MAASAAQPLSLVSDELARDSDVTVSTGVTPQAEYKGFAAHVVSGVFLAIWIAWSILPENVLHALGVYYYPSRWWALAIPAYTLVVLAYLYVGVFSYNTEVLTLPVCDNRNIVDDTGVVITELQDVKHVEDVLKYTHRSTSGIYDLPIGVVDQILG